MGLYARPLRSRLRVDRLRQIGWTRLHVGKALRWCNVQRPLDLITRFRLSTSPRTATKSQRQLTCNHSMPSVPRASSKSRGFKTRAPGCQTGLDLLLRIKSGFAPLLVIFALSALAQSPSTLEAIRGAREDALERAEADLAACLAVSCLGVNRVSLLVGYLRLSRGDPSGALQQFLSRPPPPELESIHAYYSGEARFYLRDYRGAANAFGRATLGAPGWLVSRAQHRKGEALLAAGDFVAARPLLEAGASAAPSGELYYERSLVRRAQDDLNGEREDLLRIITGYPLHPYVAPALARLTQIDQRPIQFTLQQRLARARLFSESGDFEAAIRELSEANREQLAVSKEDRAELARQLAAALLALNRVELADAQIEVARTGPPSVASEAALLRARWALRKEEHSRTRSLMVQILRRYPNQPAAEEAGFFVGWLDFQDGRLDAAISAFARLEKRSGHSHRLGDTLWLHGLALLLKRNYAAAEPAFEKLIHAVPNSDFVPQARYWSIRCQQLRGSTRDDVPSQYLQLVQLFPGTLYAFLAQERLRELGGDPPLAFTDPPRVGDEPVPTNLRLTAELVAAGLLSDADREIEAQVRGVRTEDQARHLGYVLQRLEAYGPAYALGARWLWKSAYVDRNGGALSLLYPQAYRDTVDRDAEAEGIDPFLVWAVMRRESKFRADAHSTADARGLMQVIPSTGVSIAKELALRRPAPNELFIPELNVRLGAWYLTRLVKRFGHPALIAAAYNAGPLVVAQWLEKYGDAPLDLFIEQIPYKETRNYVRQVVADYFIYHQLYGDPAKAPRLSLEIPQPSSAGVNF